METNVPRSGRLSYTKFQKDLIVWKPLMTAWDCDMLIFVSEGLNSVETLDFLLCIAVALKIVSEGLNSVETDML